ncbi:MAG: right-handed parallel beta-helix repeat-containing protein [bacterium]
MIGAVVLAAAWSAGAATLRVPSEYATINAALDASQSGDTVLVAPGTYTDSEIRYEEGFPVRSCAYLRDGVVLRSMSGPEDTIVDIAGAGGALVAVVRARQLPSEESQVDGFSITGAPVGYRGAYVAEVGRVTFRNCIFRDMDANPSSGAGIAANGNVDIIDCEFVNCQGDIAGAIYHSNGHLNLIRTTIRECGNRGAYLSGNAGGPGESALIEDCVFLNNWSEGSAGGLAVSRYDQGAVVRGCRFEGNVAYGYPGGGLAFTNFGPKLVEDCLFLMNSVTGSGQGAALTVSGNGACEIRGNTFYGNTQEYPYLGGASVHVYAPGALFDRNVVALSQGNTAIFVESGSSLTTSCNVFWDNSEGIGIPLSPTDREIDPLFCDPENHDFTVQENSPCVEPGSLGCGQIGAFGVGCGVLSVQTRSWGEIKAAYRSDAGSRCGDR